MNDVIRRINELEYMVKNNGNQEYYLDNMYKILEDFINNKINEEINNIDLELLIKNGLEEYNQKAGAPEKLLSFFNIISDCSDFLKIANPTEERKQICKIFTEKLIESFEGLINSIDLGQLQTEIDKKLEDRNEDYSEYNVTYQAYNLITALSNIMLYNNSKIRIESIKKIEEITKILEKKEDSKLYITEYMVFQERLQQILMDNICKFNQYNISPFYGEKTDNELEYNELIEEYINLLINEKVNILDRKGRVLKNYLAIVKVNPEFDKLGILEKVNEQYNIEDIDIEEECKFLDDFIENSSFMDKYGGYDIDKINVFLSHLQLVKLKSKDFTLPRKYIDYIIEKILTEEIYVNSMMNPLVETALEDLGRDDLKSMIDNTDKYLFCVRDFIQGSTIDKFAAGGAGNFGIMYSRDEIEKLSKNNVSVLDFIFHENIHIQQSRDISRSEIVNNRIYRIEKDTILKKLFPNFYGENYHLMLEEIDANQKAAEKIVNYITNFKELDEKTKKQIKEQFILTAESQKFQFISRDNIRFKGKVVNFNDLFDIIIKEKPEILQEYPHLKIEYEENGDKKSLRKILSEKKLKRTELIELISDSHIMKGSSFLEDMNFLIELSENNENVIIEWLLKINSRRIFSELSNSLNSLDIKQISEINKMISKLKEKMKQNESFNMGINNAITTPKKSNNMVTLQDLEEKVNDILLERNNSYSEK